MDIDTAAAVWTAPGPATRRDPYPSYATLRRHGPVHQVTPPGSDTPVWIVVGYEACRQALTDPRLTRDVRRLPPEGPPVDTITFLCLDRSMIASDPPDHTRLRRLAAHAFSPRRVE